MYLDSQKSHGPKFATWMEVATVKVKDFDQAFKSLTKVAPGPWKADKWSRGGLTSYDGEKNLAWKRGMTKDGKHFARIIETEKGYVIQEGEVASGPGEVEEDVDSDDS